MCKTAANNADSPTTAVAMLSPIRFLASLRRKRSESETQEQRSLVVDLWRTQRNIWSVALSTLLEYLLRQKLHLQTVFICAVALLAVCTVSAVSVVLVIGAHLLQVDLQSIYGNAATTYRRPALVRSFRERDNSASERRRHVRWSDPLVLVLN